MEDALAATKAAVEEGIIAGGGSAYVHAAEKVSAVVSGLEGDEKTGGNIILKALEAPLYHIVANAGLEGSVIVNKVKEMATGMGFDAYKEEYVDMVEAGILDPAKVTRSALQNATRRRRNGRNDVVRVKHCKKGCRNRLWQACLPEEASAAFFMRRTPGPHPFSMASRLF